MSGGDGRGPGNTGLGHNGGKPSGNVNGSSGNGGHTGNSGGGRGGMRAPTAAEVAGQFNSYGGTQITSSQVSNIRSDGNGRYSADIQGQTHTVSSGGESHTSNTVGGFSGVSTSGNGGGNHNSVSDDKGNNGSTDNGKGKTTSDPGWSSDSDKAGSYLPTKKDKLIKGFIKSIDDHSSSGTGSYTIHYTGGAVATVTVPDGDINKMNVHYDIGSGPSTGNKLTRDTIKSFMEFKKEEQTNDENEALTKTSELIADMGDKIGEHLGDKYKAVAKEVAGDIKNFQGKTIRSFDDAMASLNKITSNPAMKINQADRDALVNAWKHVDAQDMANKLGNLSKAFKVADVVMKVEKVREKSIEGYETGNWGPLMLEVESWVLSGVAVGVAMGILGYAAPVVATTVGLPVTAITIAGIIGISYLASFIDDKMADKINNEIIKPAH